MPFVSQPQLVSSAARSGDAVEYEVLDRPAPVEQVPPREKAEPTTQRRTVPAERRTTKSTVAGSKSTLYRKVGETVSYLFTICLAIAIWFVGAYFTVSYLESLNAQQHIGTLLSTMGMAPTQQTLYWSVRMVPVGLTLIEIFLAPRINWWFLKVPVVPSGRNHWLVFLSCLLPDVWTTAAGLSPALAKAVGRIDDDRWVWIGALIAGVGIALIPERLARWSFIEIRKIWWPRPSDRAVLVPSMA